MERNEEVSELEKLIKDIVMDRSEQNELYRTLTRAHVDSIAAKDEWIAKIRDFIAKKVEENEKPRIARSCIVYRCENHSDEGVFIGDLCGPCHAFVASPFKASRYSQAYRNAVRMALTILVSDDPTDLSRQSLNECLLSKEGGYAEAYRDQVKTGAEINPAPGEGKNTR